MHVHAFASAGLAAPSSASLTSHLGLIPSRRVRPTAWAARALLWLAGSAAICGHASQAAEPAADASALALGQVSVTASRSGPLSSQRIVTSVDVVHAEVLDTQVVEQSWELFNMVPGVLLTQYKQGTTSGKLSFRGFNGEGNVNAVKLLIDGIPTNSNDGNMPYLDMASPLEIDRIEVVRGTNDPRWGLHGMAGNVQMFTRQGGNEGQARLTLGSFDTREAQVAKGIETESGWAQNYFVDVRHSGGYRQHSDADKLNLAGKWFYQPSGQAWRAGLIARSYEAEAQEAGYLTQAQADADPRQSLAHNATDEGRRRLNHLSVHAEGEAVAGLSWATRAYRNQLDDLRYVTFSAASTQQERVVQETHRGVLGSLTWRANKLLQLEGGLQREWQDNVSERYNTVSQLSLTRTRSQAYSLDNTGGYVQAVITPTSQWRILPAYRIDGFSGGLYDRNTGARYGINEGYSQIRQPKISVVYAPVEGHSVYANWGRSFQIAVGGATYKGATSNGSSPASLNDGWELGWKFRPLAALEGRVAAWQQDATGEIYRQLGNPTNDSSNLGSTRRQGLDWQLNARPSDSFSAWISLTLQRAVIVAPPPANASRVGKEVDHVPHMVASAGARWVVAPRWEASATARAQSSYFIEQDNTLGRFGQYVVADLGLKHTLNDTVSLDLQLKNVFDRQYAYVWELSGQSLHGPADGRAAYVSANVRF
jgi:iron complex outermembrane receptor protein